MIDPILFSRSLKGRCYGNRFWRQSAKIGMPTFILCTGIPQRMEESYNWCTRLHRRWPLYVWVRRREVTGGVITCITVWQKFGKLWSSNPWVFQARLRRAGYTLVISGGCSMFSSVYRARKSKITKYRGVMSPTVISIFWAARFPIPCITSPDMSWSWKNCGLRQCELITKEYRGRLVITTVISRSTAGFTLTPWHRDRRYMHGVLYTGIYRSPWYMSFGWAVSVYATAVCTRTEEFLGVLWPYIYR